MAGTDVPTKRMVRAELRRAESEKRVAARSRVRRFRRCYWTWPLGHAFAQSYYSGAFCVGCDYPRKRGQ